MQIYNDFVTVLDTDWPCDQESDWSQPTPSACIPQSLSVASPSWTAWKRWVVSWRATATSDTWLTTTLTVKRRTETLPRRPVQQPGVAVVMPPDYCGCQQTTSDGDVWKQTLTAACSDRHSGLLYNECYYMRSYEITAEPTGTKFYRDTLAQVACTPANFWRIPPNGHKMAAKKRIFWTFCHQNNALFQLLPRGWFPRNLITKREYFTQADQYSKGN